MKINRQMIVLVGSGFMLSEILFILHFLGAPHETIEVIGAYLLLAGSGALMLGLWLLKGSSKYRFWLFLSLAVPATFLLMIAYFTMVSW